MQNPIPLLLGTAFAALWAVWPAIAFEPLDGCFVADRTCEATSRISDQGGSGAVAIESGTSFRLLGANRSEPTHYQIRMTSPRGDRWVPVGCGRTVAECDLSVTGPGGGSGGRPDTGRNEYLLAVSWQPAFCEGHQSKPECGDQVPGRFDATNFTLHGLWPQPNGRFYCGVPSDVRSMDRPQSWDQLPAVVLSAELHAELDEMMPGTRSSLERHEWIKHGTCYGTSQEEYFSESLQLLRELNASVVRRIMAGRIGGQIDLDQLRAAFDEAFGDGAGMRVNMSCDNDGGRQLVSELQINLAGEITSTTGLQGLMAAAPQARIGCRVGEIDPVGFQN